MEQDRLRHRGRQPTGRDQFEQPIGYHDTAPAEAVRVWLCARPHVQVESVRVDVAAVQRRPPWSVDDCPLRRRRPVAPVPPNDKPFGVPRTRRDTD
jgi:hypothetical protein